MREDARTHSEHEALQGVDVAAQSGHEVADPLAAMEGEREALQMREQLAAQLKDGALPSNQQQAIPVVGERILSRAQGQQAEDNDRSPNQKKRDRERRPDAESQLPAQAPQRQLSLAQAGLVHRHAAWSAS